MNYNAIPPNVELRKWLGGRLDEVLGTNPQDAETEEEVLTRFTDVWPSRSTTGNDTSRCHAASHGIALCIFIRKRQGCSAGEIEFCTCF